jgi:hypothetical protein
MAIDYFDCARRAQTTAAVASVPFDCADFSALSDMTWARRAGEIKNFHFMG